MAAAINQHELIGTLQQDLAHLEQRQSEWGVVSTGCAALDRLLPRRGLQRGRLVEWLVSGAGSGATTLALLAAQQACREQGTLVVVDRSGNCFPPALAALGIDVSRVIFVRPRSRQDEQWALDQTLRCPTVAAVVAEVAQLDSCYSRRFQLAAESSGALGLFLRPAHLQGEPSWADLQLLVQPLTSAAQRRWQIDVVRCRGRSSEQSLQLEFNETAKQLREIRHDTTPHFVPLVSQLAHSTALSRAVGS